MNRFLVAGVLLAGCGPSVESFTRPDYAQVDAKNVKRVALVVSPAPGGDEPTGRMWSLVARRWANQHRNFIVKRNTVAATFDQAAACKGMQGVIRLNPGAQVEGDGVEVALDAALLRCTDGERIWSAQVGGSFETDDENVQELRAHYEQEVGPSVGPQVAAAIHSVRAAFETLPQPVLTEEEEMEKIELGE